MDKSISVKVGDILKQTDGSIYIVVALDPKRGELMRPVVEGPWGLQWSKTYREPHKGTVPMFNVYITSDSFEVIGHVE